MLSKLNLCLIFIARPTPSENNFHEEFVNKFETYLVISSSQTSFLIKQTYHGFINASGLAYVS